MNVWIFMQLLLLLAIPKEKTEQLLHTLACCTFLSVKEACRRQRVSPKTFPPLLLSPAEFLVATAAGPLMLRPSVATRLTACLPLHFHSPSSSSLTLKHRGREEEEEAGLCSPNQPTGSLRKNSPSDWKGRSSCRRDKKKFKRNMWCLWSKRECSE